MKTIYLIRFAQVEVAIQGSSKKKLKIILNVSKVARKRFNRKFNLVHILCLEE